MKKSANAKRNPLPLCVFLCLLLSCSDSQPTDYSLLVNPFIGTDFTGNTYPGAQVPFGMVQISPDIGRSGWNRISGYYYPDSTIAGFSHTHLSGTGAGDLYDISFLPVTSPWREAPGALGIHSRFDHADEEAHAGYYRVRLCDYGIDVELTATERCGVQRYTCPAGRVSVFLNLAKAMNWDATLDAAVGILDSCTVEGHRFSDGWARDQRVYFRTRFSKPFLAAEVDTVPLPRPGGQHGTACIVRFDFDMQEGERLVLCTALSGVSPQGAAKNLAAECPHDDFDRYRLAARRRWNAELGKIEVRGGTHDERVCFYTALYHAFLAPTLFCDVDSLYRGADGKIHRADGLYYSTFSLWDTYRAAHPLYTLLAPSRVNDMVKSMLAFRRQHGRLPLWSLWGGETEMMIGYHAAAVIADACLKGIGDFDAREALSACVASANDDAYRGIGYYRRLGYIPFDVAAGEGGEDWSLSKTLEYAFDDGCIARLARHLGDTAVEAAFLRRAQSYRNLYNPATGFFQPRDSSGQFQPDFRPEAYTPHICESNAWHYLWSVQHDIPGLMRLLGGRGCFAARLDSLFSAPVDTAALPIFSTGMMGQYVHGNEPCHHVAYLYNPAGQPSKTQHYVRRVMRELYANAPAGLCGNEDCGQMSAWYVFSAMGFYPLDPVGGTYEIGSPLFPEVRLHLPNGKTFTLLAPGADDGRIYVRSVTAGGKPHDKSSLTHAQILDGGTVRLEMAAEPQAPWYKID